mmetsp:Transcript_2582/g.5406  ORF Transcript_2582/g.5406 Transcript_2582/m.5406 type:complete len:273 (+) Transcript_2582:236-1054(+)
MTRREIQLSGTLSRPDQVAHTVAGAAARHSCWPIGLQHLHLLYVHYTNVASRRTPLPPQLLHRYAYDVLQLLQALPLHMTRVIILPGAWWSHTPLASFTAEAKHQAIQQTPADVLAIRISDTYQRYVSALHLHVGREVPPHISPAAAIAAAIVPAAVVAHIGHHLAHHHASEKAHASPHGHGATRIAGLGGVAVGSRVRLWIAATGGDASRDRHSCALPADNRLPRLRHRDAVMLDGLHRDVLLRRQRHTPGTHALGNRRGDQNDAEDGDQR